MSASISLKGLPELKALRALKPLIRQECRKAALESARKTAARARQAAPKDKGVLASDIDATQPNKSAPIAYAGVAKGSESSDYVAPAEFGTSDTAAQPFLFPAAEAEKAGHIGRMAEAVNIAAKKLVSGGE